VSRSLGNGFSRSWDGKRFPRARSRIHPGAVIVDLASFGIRRVAPLGGPLRYRQRREPTDDPPAQLCDRSARSGTCPRVHRRVRDEATQRDEAGHVTKPAQGDPPDEEVSDLLERWLDSSGEHTVGDLLAQFEERSFALLFILLLGVSALPIPTAGATHVLDIVALLIAGQLVAGHDKVWIPKRWGKLRLAGPKRRRLINWLLKFIRLLERFSRPRLRGVFAHSSSNRLFGLLVIIFSVFAFLSPPFSGLDTLPALGVVLLSVGVLLEDFSIVTVGILTGIAGIALEIALGRAALTLL
jgi:hypothetical protein